MLSRLKQRVGPTGLRHVDYFFAEHLQQLAGGSEPLLPLAAALASHAIGNGNTCLDLSTIAGTTVLSRENGAGGIEVPPLEQLLPALQASRMVGAPGEVAPMILDEQGRLYLGRYWWYEQQVAETLRGRAQTVAPATLDLVLLRRSLQRMFPAAAGETDWQRVAAALALLRRFAVISGGPGTGKTRTVTTILALLVEQANAKPLRIALAAPTGKAAARLTESIRQAKPLIDCSEAVRQRIPEEATTLHRLLGVRPGRSEPKYHADNLLPVDLLVVDEASMIDLPMMARLLRALPAQARLILLGDKDQLASVEAGSVFADISGVNAGADYSGEFLDEIKAVTGERLAFEGQGTGFGDSVALLRKSYRFTGEKGIGSLARAINTGNSEEALFLLKTGEDGVRYRTPTKEAIPALLVEQVSHAFVTPFAAASPREALERFNSFRILCAVRRGPMGVESVNPLVEEILRSKGLIQTKGAFYPGKPIMIGRNDPSLGLFNGDVGILWPDPDAEGALRAWFILPDNTMKRVLPSRLPEHETAYAMTVHKSQGSEFARVLLLLPFEINPVLTRELLYTGLTRAKGEVELWGRDEIVGQCIQTRVRRMSGLVDKLYST